MKSLYCEDYEQVNQIIKEINFVKELKHPNLLSYEETFMNYDEENEVLSVNIIMKLCQEGDLNKYILRNELDEDKIIDFMIQICQGLEYLHKQNVIHRDIKPENVLISIEENEIVLKITDFGLSKKVSEISFAKTYCGTLYYIAPEILSGKYDEKVDLFSVESECNGYSKQLISMVIRLLNVIPNERPSSAELLKILKRMKDKKVFVVGSIPKNRYGHSSHLINDKLYIFGGYINDIKKTTNESHELLLTTLEWKKLVDVESLFEGINPFSKSNSSDKLQEIRGCLPSTRCWHSSTVYDNSFVVMGGCGDYEYFNDIYKYQYNFQKWLKMPIKLPKLLAKHSTVKFEDSLFVFGGMFYEKKFFINNDLFEISSLKDIKKVECSGDIPSERFGHSAVVYNSCMYVFGGQNEKTTNNELYELNFQTKKWTKIETEGDLPTIRTDHTCLIYKNSMIVIGGLESFDHISQNLSQRLVYQYFFEQKKWKYIEFTGDFPFKLSQHTSVLVGDEIFSFGGMTYHLSSGHENPRPSEGKKYSFFVSLKNKLKNSNKEISSAHHSESSGMNSNQELKLKFFEKKFHEYDEKFELYDKTIEKLTKEIKRLNEIIEKKE
eukprot:gene6507-10515_t